VGYIPQLLISYRWHLVGNAAVVKFCFCWNDTCSYRKLTALAIVKFAIPHQELIIYDTNELHLCHPMFQFRFTPFTQQKTIHICWLLGSRLLCLLPAIHVVSNGIRMNQSSVHSHNECKSIQYMLQHNNTEYYKLYIGLPYLNLQVRSEHSHSFN